MSAIRKSAKVVGGGVRGIWWIILLASIAYHAGRIVANLETRFYLAKAAEWLRTGLVGENWAALDFLFDDGLTWILSVLFGVALKSVYDLSKRAFRARRQHTADQL